MTIRRHRLFIPAEINGHRVQALLDSAAELTLLDRAFARRLDLLGGTKVDAKGSGAGKVGAELIEAVTMTAPGIIRHTGPAAAIDLGDVSRRLNGAPIDVILGRDYFDLVRLEIDIDARRLRPLAPDEPARGLLFPLKTAFGVETIIVNAEGHGAEATIDLGNGGNPMVSRAFAAHIGAFNDGRAMGKSRGGGTGGEAERVHFILKALSIGPKNFVDIPVIVDVGEGATDMNIGTSILRRFVVTTDFANHQVWRLPK
ncbi:retropepsin-like aspartic protease [Novosphingobium sp.]|uniref:retropepsin-like aspartic protease n=1 Tax=Novosphingobium sp. TaxID=1874826 RepID=UPI003BAC8408